MGALRSPMLVTNEEIFRLSADPKQVTGFTHDIDDSPNVGDEVNDLDKAYVTSSSSSQTRGKTGFASRSTM